MVSRTVGLKRYLDADITSNENHVAKIHNTDWAQKLFAVLCTHTFWHEDNTGEELSYTWQEAVYIIELMRMQANIPEARYKPNVADGDYVYWYKTSESTHYQEVINDLTGWISVPKEQP